MNSYPSYKDSGVEWMGEIPSDWIKSKFKYETNVPVQYGINTSSEFYIENGIRFIRTTDITDDGKIKEGGVYLEIDSVEDIYRTKINDFLISRSGTLGRTYLHNNENEMTYGGYLVRFNFGDKTKSKFIFYYSKSKNFEDWLSLNTIQSTIGNVNGQKYSNLSVPLPPKETQTQIVSFLDTKTQKIDELIEKTEQKIELLKEKRTSLINHCVTKGLNPNVGMKDSGVEWIGEIPSHWILNKVGNNTYVKGRIGWKGLRSEDFIDEGPYLITGTDFNSDGTINWNNMYHVDQQRYDEDPFIQLKDNDVLITKDGTIGKVVHVGNLKGQTCLNSGIFLTRPTNNQYVSRFFFWMLKSNVFKIFVDYNSGGSTIQHLYQNVFINLKFPIPPLEEQTQIIEYLDDQTQKIDTTIEKEAKRIELLKEYRQSLISEVVTGKIDVRNEVVV